MNDKILFDICIPTIVKDVDFNKTDTFKSRISYFTGIRFTSNDSISLYTGTGVVDLVFIKTNYFPLVMYGYAGSFDNPYNATIDLNFGIQPEYYYGRSYPFKVTENTLYNRYYSNYIFEMTSKDSRILRCYMKIIKLLEGSELLYHVTDEVSMRGILRLGGLQLSDLRYSSFERGMVDGIN